MGKPYGGQIFEGQKEEHDNIGTPSVLRFHGVALFGLKLIPRLTCPH